jgi:hypothetical protein
MSTIKIYIFDNEPTKQLFPLVEILWENNSDLLAHYEIVTKIEDAHFVVLAKIVENFILEKGKKKVSNLINFAKKHVKKIVLFSTGDFGTTIHSEEVITVRLGGFKKTMNKNTFIMPPFFDDPATKFKINFELLEKQNIPTIGFVGHSNGSLTKLIKEFIIFCKGTIFRLMNKEVTDFQDFYPSSYFRHKYLQLIQQNDQIKSNFIFRKKYRAGVKTEADKLKTTLEFYNNINSNLFTFCMRGSGNFSVRFYETLSLGKIPVFIDTDCKFPFDNKINWQKNCIIVPENEVNLVVNKILSFHEKHSNEALKVIQNENRTLWLNQLTRVNYFIQLKQELKNLI